MAEEVPNVAANLAQMGELLDEYGFDYQDIRVAVTTTSVSGPACADFPGTGGAPVTQTCHDRIDAFVHPGGIDGLEDPVDLRQTGCLDHCPHPRIDFGPDPWFTLSPLGDTLPPGVSAAEALTCLGSQGLGGCPIESPVAATQRFLRAARNREPPVGRFLRDDATLYVVIVTDEADCSGMDDPDATSADCWDAGVVCEPICSSRSESTGAGRYSQPGLRSGSSVGFRRATGGVPPSSSTPQPATHRFGGRSEWTRAA